MARHPPEGADCHNRAVAASVLPGAAAEHDDGVGYRIRRSLPLTCCTDLSPSLLPDAARFSLSGQMLAVIASAPLIRTASAAARKRSISPSSTALVFPVSTPVRRSLTI